MRLTILLVTAFSLPALAACQTPALRDTVFEQAVNNAAQTVAGTGESPESGLQEAMRDFRLAIVDTDEAEVLSSFSKEKTWRLVNYDIDTAKAYYQEDVSYAEMADDWMSQRGWWFFFFEETDGAMAYRYNFDGGVKWRYEGNNTFVAPDSNSGNTYIRWRKEGENWVIAEIGQTLV
jgi:hypothetical protein